MIRKRLHSDISRPPSVIVDGNDVENFTRRFNTSYNNMKDKFEDLNDNFVYTLTETAMPETVNEQPDER